MSEIERLETNRAGLGNTDISPLTQGKQSTYWCFTYNNYDLDQIEHLEHILKHECNWYVFQEEIGENNTKHLQGTIYLKKRKRLTELKCFHASIHWEVTKRVSASIAYCSKTETRNGNIYTYNIEIPEEVTVYEPYGWQIEVMNILKDKPCNRIIHWFWEPVGNRGKTTLCKYLCVKHGATMLTGKSNDMFHVISKTKKKNLFIVDCPRSIQDYINYGAIEQIKNGLIFSGKYDGQQLIFNCPHVVVFANCEPDFEKLSADRWHVVEI